MSVAVSQEACVNGVSTRSVGELLKAMGMSVISKTQGLAGSSLLFLALWGLPAAAQVVHP